MAGISQASINMFIAILNDYYIKHQQVLDAEKQAKSRGLGC